MKNFIKNRKGFTLVELVVVIAIIGILAGLAIPRFMDATTSARGAKVAGDMRIIESAIMMQYAEKGTEPKDLNELVTNNYLAAVPEPIKGSSDFKIGDHTFTSTAKPEYGLTTTTPVRVTFDGDTNTIEKYLDGSASNKKAQS
ncbi:competence type IV pilus major pilin ComGC [Phascolarctobacterium sp.]